MENMKVSIEYTNNNEFKGRVNSRVYHNEINFYATTKLKGGTFSTFDQADEFMKKLGYYNLEEMANTKGLEHRQFPIYNSRA